MTAHLRFYRRVRLMKGVTLNFGKRGLNSVSLGTRGAHYTVGRRGRRATVGLPGTGLYVTEETPWTAGSNASTRTSPSWFSILVCAAIFVAAMAIGAAVIQ